jgi:UDP-glucuronate decarboxylase
MHILRSGNFIRDALWRDEIVVGGDGMPVRSYLDQRDLADWLVVLLMQGAANRAYNVGSDQAISIGELAHLVRDVVAPRKVVRVLGQANAGNGKNLYIPAISRVRQEMGLDITFPLRAAIKMSA